VFGLDGRIASFSDGTTLLIVLGVSVLLGLRHASDPDHLAAVTTLIAAKREQAVRRAARLGFTWGLGHATSLFVFGLPVVLYRAYLPEPVQSGAETVVGILIVALALWLLVRWRRGIFHVDDHAHVQARAPWQAYVIGLVHGLGGTAGVGILLLASIPNRGLAVASLALFAVCTAVSMAVLSTGFGAALGRPRVVRGFSRLAPVLGVASLAFGTWYALGAQGVIAYTL
jgi:high-affinity nickel permease